MFCHFENIKVNILIIIIYTCSEFRQCVRRSSRGRRPSTTEIEKKVNKEFVDWFHKQVSDYFII